MRAGSSSLSQTPMIPPAARGTWAAMITIYRGGTDGLERVNKYESGTWVNVVNPTQKEIEELVSWFNIPSDFLTDPLDVDERARIEREEGCILIL